VGSVDYVLGYEAPAGARAAQPGLEGLPGLTENTLALTPDGLLLQNNDEVAALQFTVSGATQGQLRIGDDLRGLFTVAMRSIAGGVRVVAYSTEGRTLAAGSHQLLGMLPAGAVVTDACLSDGEAHRLGVGIDGTTTSLLSTAKFAQSDVQEVYDLSGRRLTTDWSQLPQGVYVIRVNGKQYKVKK